MNQLCRSNFHLLPAAGALVVLATHVIAGPASNSLILPPLDNDQLLADSARQARNVTHFAEARTVDVSPTTMGTWEDVGGGLMQWTFLVKSPGAFSLNLGFTRYHVPAGSVLTVSSLDGNTTLGPFTESDNEEHGQLWTPILPGDEALIQLTVPTDRVPEVDLVLGFVNHDFLGVLGSDLSPNRSFACNIDINCAEGAAYQIEKRAVGMYSIGGVNVCSGVLVNNTQVSGAPYFLTADHCGVDSGNAATVVVYWNYENSACRTPGGGASGSPGDGSLADFSTGAFLRVSDGDSDVALLELDDPLDPSFGLVHAGWDATTSDRSGGACVHHPNNEEKRISYTTTTITEGDPGGGLDLQYFLTWDEGDLEGGSSGAPLFEETTNRVLGVASLSTADSCTTRFASFGQLGNAWLLLEPFLDPAGGTTVLDRANGFGLDSFVFDDTAGGDGDMVLEPGESAELEFHVSYWGPQPGVNISTATINVAASDVTATTDTATYPAAPWGVSVVGAAPFVVEANSLMNCLQDPTVTLVLGTSIGTRTVEVQIPRPTGEAFGQDLAVTDDSVAGNSDGILNPGETIGLDLPVLYGGPNANSPALAATLSTTDPLVTIVQGVSGYPPITNGGSAINDTPFEIQIDAGRNCDPFDVMLSFNTGCLQQLLYTITPGSVGGTVTSTYTVTPEMAFTTSDGLAFAQFDITDSYPITDMNVTVTITADELNNTELLILAPGNLDPFNPDVFFYGQNEAFGNQLVDTMFSDEAVDLISSGSEPYTGSFLPGSSLSALDGLDVNGTWYVVLLNGNTFGTFHSATLSVEHIGTVCTPYTVGAGVMGWHLYE